jgi:hypothetical protein
MANRIQNRMHKVGPLPGHRYGMAAVFTALEGIEFPKSKDDLIHTRGDQIIEWYKGQPEDLKGLLSEIGQDDFLNMTDLTSAIGRLVESAADRRKLRREGKGSRSR